MTKEWKSPKLDVLTIGMTMAGPGVRTPDGVQPDPDPSDMVHYS